MAIRCVRLEVTDRNSYDPVALAVALLRAVRTLHPDSLAVDAGRLAQLLGTDRVWEDLQAGRGVSGIVEGWTPLLAAFRTARTGSLLYR